MTFPQALQRFAHRNRGRQARRPKTSRQRFELEALEALEGRQLMSVGPEFIAPINTTTRNAQFDSDNASSSNGSSVVVWTDTFSPTDHDIRAQRFNSFGTLTRIFHPPFGRLSADYT